MTLRTLNYGNYGIFLIVGHAGFCPSTEGAPALKQKGGWMELSIAIFSGGSGACIGDEAKYILLSLGIKTAQKPYIVWSLGPKPSIYESLDS